MTSIYDEVKTAEELVQRVQREGLSTNINDICRAQDIFGQSSIEELVDLAHDNGKRNSHGEKDPRGTWSSGTDGLSATFYSILFTIWNWETATRFYNQYSNFQALDHVKELTDTITKLESKCEEDSEELTKLKNEHLMVLEELSQCRKECNHWKSLYLKVVDNPLECAAEQIATLKSDINLLKSRILDIENEYNDLSISD